MEDKWISVKVQLPEAGNVVDTKIDDEKGIRNEQPLFLSIDGLWWAPDFSMYFDYANAPTHWKKTT